MLFLWNLKPKNYSGTINSNISNSRNLIGWTWRRTLKHTESRSRWYNGESAMVRWWKRDGTMVKTRWYERETTIVRWWNNDGTMVKQRRHDDENVMVRWWKHDVTMVKIRWYDDETAMAWWWKRDIIFTIVSSHHRDFTIVPSLFHHRAIVFSSSYHRTIALSPLYHRASRFRETKNVTYVQTEHRNRAIFERYNIVTRFASRRNLASRFASRTSTRDKKILWGHIPLNSIPFIFYIKLTFFKELQNIARPILENKSLSHFKELW
jgi:hypothetical protein